MQFMFKIATTSSFSDRQGFFLTRGLRPSLLAQSFDKLRDGDRIPVQMTMALDHSSTPARSKSSGQLTVILAYAAHCVSVSVIVIGLQIQTLYASKCKNRSFQHRPFVGTKKGGKKRRIEKSCACTWSCTYGR